MANEYIISDAVREGRADALIRALCESIIPLDVITLDEERRARVLERVAGFVQDELECIALPQRMAFNLGMWVFRTWVLARHGRGFLSLTHEQRRDEAAAWTWGKMAMARQLFRVVRSTAFLAFYEDGEVSSELLDVSSGRGARQA